MFRYEFCGDSIASTVELPELVTSPSDVSGVPAWICSPGLVPNDVGVPLHEWLDPDERVWLRIARVGSSFRLAFPLGVTFIVDDDSIGWSTEEGIPAETTRHLLIDQVLPMAISARGAMALHGSAVSVEGRAVVFAGPSGSGKSTLAGWFGAHGDAVLADDCVRLGEQDGIWSVVPAYPGLRVWPDAAAILGHERDLPRVAHYSSKVRVSLPSIGVAQVPLSCVYLVERTDETAPSVRTATAATVVGLMSYVFRIDIGHRERLSVDFARAARLVELGIVRHLRVPHSFDQLDDVRRMIQEDVSRHECAQKERCA